MKKEIIRFDSFTNWVARANQEGYSITSTGERGIALDYASNVKGNFSRHPEDSSLNKGWLEVRAR